MLAIPDETVHRTKIADWLELKAISSPHAKVGFGTLISASALIENSQIEDIGDEDMRDETLVLDAQSEIDRRQRNIGSDYPFKINERGNALCFVEPVTKVGSVYLFCLYLSHAHGYEIVPKGLAPKVTNEARDLFQACATVAAGGFVRGPAISFGYPRPEGENFLAALHRVYELFGDGKPVDKPRPAAPTKVKDNGIDIIAWTRSIDNLPCTMYLVAQVASGNDWESKSVVTDRRHFHKYWFTQAPGSPPHDAMFMPFELEPEVKKDGTEYDEILKDYMAGSGYRFGNIFYRDRIVRHVAIGLAHIQSGETCIERHEEIERIVKWVNKYTARLRAHD
jgi:hypothetical protein